jgi:hypothetical protein
MKCSFLHPRAVVDADEQRPSRSAWHGRVRDFGADDAGSTASTSCRLAESFWPEVAQNGREDVSNSRKNAASYAQKVLCLCARRNLFLARRST